ncbi:Geminivirus AR1/BR1 coat protein [Gossypium australe]|uniref:Geminivirus AR1/BR1 coat protein n=1 Tax=Gossypium australe TaxID=47621 RepID=A0A5B6WYP2_9ROSI|nr:Geminivirus AR1/BR1 coat protein [Gossypium australe]
MLGELKSMVGNHNLLIPKHSIIAWMTILARLATKGELILKGLVVDGQRKLCDSGLETRDHSFFDCQFSQQIWEAAVRLCKIDRRDLAWWHQQYELEWAYTRLKKGMLRKIIDRIDTVNLQQCIGQGLID